MFKAELHCHTTYSDGRDSVRKVIEAAIAKGINIIAITDHDCVEASLEAEEIVEEENLPLRVITASEITTTNGHLLAYGIRRDVDAGMDIAETCEEVRRLGGLTFVAHPFDFIRGGTLRLKSFSVADGVEVFNSKSYVNFLARRFAKRFEKPGIAGSDAHSVRSVGLAVNLLKDSSLNSLLSASYVARRMPIGERLRSLLPPPRRKP
ncbi:MAG: PHP domain-containing protein [Archaeoglobaceae archaeon]